MRMIPINEAESVIETYFGSGATHDPKTGKSILDEYTLTTFPEDLHAKKFLEWKTTWCAVELNLKRKNDFYLGVIAPDLSKQIGKPREISHFLINFL